MKSLPAELLMLLPILAGLAFVAWFARDEPPETRPQCRIRGCTGHYGPTMGDE